MRIKAILHIIGGLALAIGVCMALPLAFSLFYRDNGRLPLVAAMLTSVGLGAGLLLLFRRQFDRGAVLNPREGVATVACGWFAAGLLGALPYIFGNVLPTWTDAAFESFSGFSTTGSTVLANIEAVAPGILLWRSMTHWLGGMGIIVLSLAILPYLGAGGMQLYKAEVPGPTPDRMTPRLKDTAVILWQVYILMTVVQTLLLWLGEMNLFEALAHTFATVATGGFSTRNASLAAFGPYSQWVCTVFMFLAGVNFVLHFNLLRGAGWSVFKDEELRLYVHITFGAIIIVLIQRLLAGSVPFEENLRSTTFQAIAILTTTGFVVSDYITWPALSQVVILLLMVVGGSAGSTGGGVKCMRILVAGKMLYHEMFRLVHPNAVRLLKFNRVALPPNVVTGCFSFLSLYVIIWAASSMLVSATGVDLATSSSAALTCLSNVGPGFASVGPVDNFLHLPALAKWVLSLDMLLGRLELFTIFVLCFPEFWRR